MTAGRFFCTLLDRYGQRVELYPRETEEGRAVRAFIQPIREEGKAQSLPSPLGIRREDRFLLLGEPDSPVAQGDRAVWNGGDYRVQSAHPIYAGTALSHWWAVLVPRDREET